MELVKRVEAVQKTVDHFIFKEFVWGERDCAHLVAHCLQQLGHPDPLSDIPKYKTYLGAKRVMKRAGIARFEDRLDSLFERIAPAAALPGDIVAIASDVPDMVSLGIRLSGANLLAFSPIENAGDRCAIGPYTIADKAWRVVPCL